MAPATNSSKLGNEICQFFPLGHEANKESSPGRLGLGCSPCAYAITRTRLGADWPNRRCSCESEVGLEQAEVNGVDQVVSGEISPRIVAVLPLRFAECGRQYSKVHGVHYVAVVAVTRSQQAHFLVVRAVGYVDAPRVRQGLRRLYA